MTSFITSSSSDCILMIYSGPTVQSKQIQGFNINNYNNGSSLVETEKDRAFNWKQSKTTFTSSNFNNNCCFNITW